VGKRDQKPKAHDDEPNWLAVIARALALVALRQAQQDRPTEVGSVLAKADFLESLGLPPHEAAAAVGSTQHSIQVMRSRKKGAGIGKRKKDS
jgi:hypothetical protein